MTVSVRQLWILVQALDSCMYCPNSETGRRIDQVGNYGSPSHVSVEGEVDLDILQIRIRSFDFGGRGDESDVQDLGTGK